MRFIFICLFVLSASAVEKVSFSEQIRPIFNRKCTGCHGGVKQAGGLSLLYKKMAYGKTEHGIGIVPGKPAESMVYKVISNPPEIFDKKKGKKRHLEKMPLEKEPLTAAEVALIKRWIEEGADWEEHWAYDPVSESKLPKVKTKPANYVDNFIFSKLESMGMTPSKRASKGELLRRLSLDLTGLPPSEADYKGFMNDQSSQAYEKMVDKYLASSDYGERWSGMWLDLARYADTQGYEKDNARTIWRFRDEVIKSFNQDIPYSKFLINQMAGDMLPNPTEQQQVLTAFHRNTMTNTEGGTNDEEFRIAAVIDRVNTTWEAFMGTSYGCVQCHTHPYDPFTHSEYYQFMAFLNNTEDSDKSNEAPFIKTPTAEEVAKLEKMKSDLKFLGEEIKSKSLKTGKTASAKQGDNHILIFSSLKSQVGNTLKMTGDGTVLAAKTAAEKDIYTLQAKTKAGAVGYLKLDAIPHESLNKTSGVNGNFVISDLSLTIKRNTPVKGRYVRISLNKKDILQLAEVQVLNKGKNIALKKNASQSSTYTEASASRAVDGKTNGKFEKGSVSHTNNEKNPWWEVDLAQHSSIEKIIIFNRSEAPERLNNYTVSVLNNKKQVIWQKTVLKASMKNQHHISGDFKVKFVSSQANYEQKGFGINDSINGLNKDLGWAVAPKLEQKNTAWISPDKPVALQPGDALEVKIACESKWKNHIIGHFRVSIGENIPSFLQEPPEIKELKAKQKKLADSIKKFKITTTPVMKELPAEKRRKTNVFVRGSWEDLAEEVSEGTPEVLNAFKANWPKNRLGMAYWMTDPANPLTARVAVNRFWEQLFGTGIVETLEDFGSQGAKPSHPELLDNLAWNFVHTHNWSVKKLLKDIVMSSTYQQSSVVSKELLEKDSFNKFLARGPRFRLSSEQLRDQALKVSGLLKSKLYGPSVMPYQPEGVWMTVYNGGKWIIGKNGEQHRRALYTYWKRTSPYPSMETFDTPSREVCKVRRIRTNTPLQALVTLNDPAYVECAEAFAGLIIENGGKSITGRINYAYEKALCRQPRDREVATLKDLYDDSVKRFKKDEKQAWAVVAGVIMNLDEFLTKK